MMSLKKKAAVALTVASVAAGSFAVPAMAQTRGFDATRLDKAQVEYTQYRYRHGYRGHWRGPSRGAAVAGAIGLGILGAAAIAAQGSRGATGASDPNSRFASASANARSGYAIAV